jgi:hypothetical protein
MCFNVVENVSATLISFLADRLVAADYFDRRAQARYMSEHPGSHLSPEERPQFASTVADPAYQSQHRGLIGTLSGGMLGRSGDRRRQRRAFRRAYKDERRIMRGRAPRLLRRGPKGRPGDPGYQPTGIARLMQKDVLYLTIVNMPSDEELQEAVARLHELKERK